MQLKAYIASPFFNEEQIERVEFIKSILYSKGIAYYSPKDELVVSDLNSKKELKECFEANVLNIDTCDFIVAVTDGKDVGTIWECGYGYGQSKPIVYFAETLGDNKFNLMLAQSGVKVCLSRDELKAVDFKEAVFEEEGNDYDGKIE